MKFILFSILCISIVFTSCTKKNTETSERFYFRHDGADLAVQVDGNIYSNVFILLLHGGPGGGSSAYNSKLFSDKLEEKYAMVYVDQRGNGASQGNFSQYDLSLNQNSKDIYALARFLKKKYGDDISLFLMGHSWGGMTSAHALISTDIQSELNGWIIIDGIYDYNKNSIEAFKMLLEIGNEEVALGNNVDFWNTALTEIGAIDTNNITEADRIPLYKYGILAQQKFPSIANMDSEDNSEFGWLTDPEGGFSATLYNNWSNVPLNLNSAKNPLTDRLNEIQIPSQFLWGKYDFLVPPGMGIHAHNSIGTNEKELVIFQNSSHTPMRSETLLFVQEVSDFIELYK
jgi:pimeloyl-ACP methyl ester carboxylesterase